MILIIGRVHMALKTGIKAKVGWIMILILSFTPIIIWGFIRPLDERFLSPMAVLTSFGQIAGLAGMAIFSLNLVLASRAKFLEDYFGGLNRMYISHHILGTASFVLLLAHPIFLAGKYLLISARSAALFLLPGRVWYADVGMTALYGMMAIMILTFYAKIKYQSWKSYHKFLGFFLFLGSIHAFFVPSDISQNPALEIYMLSLVATGLAAYVWQIALKRFLNPKFSYAVRSVKDLGEGIIEIEMEPAGKAMNFAPGQFIFVSFYDHAIEPESHPFSISSSPYEKNLKIAVKSLGDYTSGLKYLKRGAIAKVEGPFGRFFDSGNENREQIWMAGGIGITPFLSMARSFKGSNPGRSADLYYCVKNEREAVFLDELMEISSRAKNLRIIPFFSDSQGFISAEHINRSSDNVSGKDIFLCGPPPMMKSLKNGFLKLNISSDNIYSEEFQLI